MLTRTEPEAQELPPHEQVPALSPTQLQHTAPLHSFEALNIAPQAQPEELLWHPMRTQEQAVASLQHKAGPPSSVASQTWTGFRGGLSPPSVHSQDDGAPTASQGRFSAVDDEEDEQAVMNAKQLNRILHARSSRNPGTLAFLVLARRKCDVKSTSSMAARACIATIVSEDWRGVFKYRIDRSSGT